VSISVHTNCLWGSRPCGHKVQGISRFWRWVSPVAVAGGLIAASGAIPAQAASSAAYSVTISATSPNYPGATNGLVFGYALVVYKGSDGTAVATISGSVTGNSGDAVTLLDKRFGSRRFKSSGQSLTLTGTAAQSYSFEVTPSLATKYEIRVSTGATVDATSGIKTVYVTENTGPGISTKTTCSSHGHCTVHGKGYLVLPASGYRTESRKRWYIYFVYDPKVLKYLYLDRHASFSKAHRISATEFEFGVTIPFRSRGLSNPGKHVYWGSCTRDTEAKDGLGLPGHHGCGARRIDVLTLVYVG
jgi:hypothetical protein